MFPPRDIGPTGENHHAGRDMLGGLATAVNTLLGDQGGAATKATPSCAWTWRSQRVFLPRTVQRRSTKSFITSWTSSLV